ncbi:hypothetical protein M0802_017003 [Mischocyttarus mexicanus]|nr:hypothetical protein M0802_017003 [Mischocyttarus mexicanus]
MSTMPAARCVAAVTAVTAAATATAAAIATVTCYSPSVLSLSLFRSFDLSVYPSCDHDTRKYHLSLYRTRLARTFFQEPLPSLFQYFLYFFSFPDFSLTCLGFSFYSNVDHYVSWN